MITYQFEGGSKDGMRESFSDKDGPATDFHLSTSEKYENAGLISHKWSCE
jgi:hypothetical protein